MIQPPDTAEMCYNTTRFEGLRIALHEWGKEFASLNLHQSKMPKGRGSGVMLFLAAVSPRLNGTFPELGCLPK